MVTVEWANAEKNVIRWRFVQPWTWEEFYIAQKQVHVMIDSVDGLVDCMFIPGKPLMIPPNPTIHLRKIIAQRHRRLNLVILVGANRFLSALLQIMVRWVPGFELQLRYVLSEQKAFAVSQSDRHRRSEEGHDREYQVSR